MEFHSEHLRDNVQVGYESRLQNDGDIGGVEEFDWVAAVLTTVPGRLDWEIDPESLEKVECQRLVCI